MLPSRVTLDPKVLIAVEDGAPRATAALGVLLRLGYTPQVTPVVLSALWRMAEGNGNAIERGLALEAMQGMKDRSGYELDEFSGAEKTAVATLAGRLISSDAIPGGTMADAKLLVEASYRDGRTALLTRRTPILEANRSLLDVTLEDCGLGRAGSLKIYSPEILAQYAARVIEQGRA